MVEGESPPRQAIERGYSVYIGGGVIALIVIIILLVWLF
jgi:hypothetical protein